MSDADDAKMIEEMERLEREATAGPWVDGYVSGFCRKEHGPDEGGPWHGKGFCEYQYDVTECSDAHRLASTSAITEVAGNYDCDAGGIIKPEDHAFITYARNNLPRLIALAKIGLEASKKEQTMSGGHFQSVPYAQSKLRTLADEIERDATLLTLLGAERRKEFAVFLGHVADMVELLDKHAAGDMGEETFSEAMTTLVSSTFFFDMYRLNTAQRNADFHLRKKLIGGRQWDQKEQP